MAKSAAQALYPNLPSAERPEVEQRRPPNVGDAMWPSLSREAKARDAYREQEHQRLLRNLRALNARIDARLAREGRR
jgi:hypothetical protein